MTWGDVRGGGVESLDEELPHQTFVFVVDHMAMVHERIGRTGKIIESSYETDRAIARNAHGVFPAFFVRGNGTTHARDDLELDVMNVEGMAEGHVIFDRPFFRRVQGYVMIDDVHIVGHSVERKGRPWAHIGNG